MAHSTDQNRFLHPTHVKPGIPGYLNATLAALNREDISAYLWVSCCYLLLQLGRSEEQIICNREGVTERWRGGVLSGIGGQSESMRERGREGAERELLLSQCSSKPVRSSVHVQCAIPLKTRQCMHSPCSLSRI